MWFTAEALRTRRKSNKDFILKKSRRTPCLRGEYAFAKNPETRQTKRAISALPMAPSFTVFPEWNQP